MEYQFLTEVLMLLLAAVVILYLFRRLRLPPVLGYLVFAVMLNAIRRDGITGRGPLPETRLRAGDVLCSSVHLKRWNAVSQYS